MTTRSRLDDCEFSMCSFSCLYVSTTDKSPQFSCMDGAILVFLPGLAHIQQLYDLLSNDKRFRLRDR